MVQSIPYAGGGNPTTLTPTAEEPASITSDGDQQLFWAFYYNLDIETEAVGGSSATTFADWSQIGGPPTHAGPLWASSGYLYWTTWSPPAVLRIRTTAADQHGYEPIAIASAAPDGGTTPGGGLPQAVQPISVVADATDVYWVDAHDPIYRAIYHLDLAHVGDPTARPDAFVIAEQRNGNQSWLALDSDRVYWITEYGAVLSKPRQGGSDVTTYQQALSTKAAPVGITVDDTFVYWVMTDGSVMAAVKSGTKVFPVACPNTDPTSVSPFTPVAIATDCGAVFWAWAGGADPSGDGGVVPAAVLAAARPSSTP
jgi:hypothetical protein